MAKAIQREVAKRIRAAFRNCVEERDASLLVRASFLRVDNLAKAVHEQVAKRIANAARILTGQFGESQT